MRMTRQKAREATSPREERPGNNQEADEAQKQHDHQGEQRKHH